MARKFVGSCSCEPSDRVLLLGAFYLVSARAMLNQAASVDQSRAPIGCGGLHKC